MSTAVRSTRTWIVHLVWLPVEGAEPATISIQAQDTYALQVSYNIALDGTTGKRLYVHGSRPMHPNGQRHIERAARGLVTTDANMRRVFKGSSYRPENAVTRCSVPGPGHPVCRIREMQYRHELLHTHILSPRVTLIMWCAPGSKSWTTMHSRRTDFWAGWRSGLIDYPTVFDFSGLKVQTVSRTEPAYWSIHV